MESISDKMSVNCNNCGSYLGHGVMRGQLEEEQWNCVILRDLLCCRRGDDFLRYDNLSTRFGKDILEILKVNLLRVGF